MAGNAIIGTNSSSGYVTTSLWLQSIQTGVDTQFDGNQVKRGISWRPIRRSESFLDFTAIWSLKNYDKMYAFQEKIRNHYNMVAQGDQIPMRLVYKSNVNVKNGSGQKAFLPDSTPYQKNAMQFYGWINSAQQEFVRFKDFFIKSYRMNIVLPEMIFESGEAVDIDPNYDGLVTPNYIGFYGSGWIAAPTKTNYNKVNDNPSPDTNLNAPGRYFTPQVF